MEKEFIQGMFLNEKRENAPDFVKGSLSIKVDKFVEYLKQKQNSSGYVNIDLLESRDGRLYLKLNDFKPKEKNTEKEIINNNSEYLSTEDIPF